VKGFPRKRPTHSHKNEEQPEKHEPKKQNKAPVTDPKEMEAEVSISDSF
jgi:hypothetical protein